MGRKRGYRPFEPIPPKNEVLSCRIRADLHPPKGKGRGELPGLAGSGVLVVWPGVACVWSLPALVKSKPAVFRTRVSKNERGGAVIDGGMLDCGSTEARIADVTGQTVATRWLTPQCPRPILSLRYLPLTVLFCEPRMNLIWT